MKRVAIIGAGELGAALGKVLASKAEVRLWDVDGSKVPGMKPLKEVVSEAEIVFCAVPSFAMRQAVVGFLPYIGISRTVIISLAKGIESRTRKTMDEVLAEVVPTGLWGVVGGPMLAAELAANKKCAAVVASSQKVVCAAVKDCFEGTNLVIETSSDVHGVMLAGVLKNIYAVAMGIAAGLGWGEDETGWLASRAMEEMAAIGLKLGAREATVRGTAGSADFLATAYSEHSRNRNSGVALASDGAPAVKGEGILSLPSLLELLGSNADSFAVLSALADVVLKNRNAREVFDILFTHGSLPKIQA
jgi:glycerol-3-phosphate dehydrogenase (NAD(P)+)